MQRTIGRLGLGIVLGLAFFAVSAAPALAATVTTKPATQVRTTSATLTVSSTRGGWRPCGSSSGVPRRSTAGALRSSRSRRGMERSGCVAGAQPHSEHHVPFPPGCLDRERRDLLSADPRVRARYEVQDDGDRQVGAAKSSPDCHQQLLVRSAAMHEWAAMPRPIHDQRGGRIQGTHESANVLCATTFFTIGAHRKGNVRVRVRRGCLALLRPYRQCAREADVQPPNRAEGVDHDCEPGARIGRLRRRDAADPPHPGALPACEGQKSFHRDLGVAGDRRAIRSFFIARVDRDKVVVAGGMSPRSTEFLEAAVRRLAAARGAADMDPAGAVSAACYAMPFQSSAVRRSGAVSADRLGGR